MHSFWDEMIYVVLNRKDPYAAVYEVGPANQDGRIRIYGEIFNTMPTLSHKENQKATGKRPTKKTTNHAAEFEHVPEHPETTVTEAEVKEDVEEIFLTPSLIHLKQVRHYFEGK